MNTKIYLGIAVLIVLLGGVWFYVDNNVGNNEKAAIQSVVAPSASSGTGAAVASSSSGDIQISAQTGGGKLQITPLPITPKEFTITAKNYSFSPANLAVKKGDAVKITLNNTEGFHDLKIDEFNVATKRISGGASDTVEFIANKTGSFEFYCSVGNHRAMGMKGTLTVTE